MQLRAQAFQVYPGLLLSGLVAISVAYISDNFGGPAMLYALLIGMALHFLSDDSRLAPGIEFASKSVLRIGVALLGARIVIGDIVDIGGALIILVVAGLLATIILGQSIGRLCGLKADHALLSAGAVAICGASATLAISSVLPSQPNGERNTIMTVALVTTMSTVVMIIYPILITILQFDDATAGIFLGATIHDVAQVVGAGYMVSQETGEISTVIKLTRVMCLVPVITFISFYFRFRSRTSLEREKIQYFPVFLIVFILLTAANSMDRIPPLLAESLVPISSWCLLAAVSALGLKSDLRSLAEVGVRPLVAMTLQTVFLTSFVLVGLTLLK